jgi:uroporphyrin-III C-methyltransferase/precorrin-2 dehydrogenase/sirohydrochlorin ferrochelatase
MTRPKTTIASLPLFHRIAGQPVIVLGEGEAADAKRRLVERAGGIPVGEAAEARLAFVAPDTSDDQPEAAVARLQARGILVNCVDRPDLCDFTSPSILDRSPVLLAIGTGGASAGLAKALRLRLEQLLPQRLGALAAALAGARSAMRRRWPDAGERRRALDAALASGGSLDPLVEAGEERVEQWLSGGETTPGGIIELQLISADPEDLTLRQARLLGSADVVAYEADIAQALLDRARADAVRLEISPGARVLHRDGLTIVLRMPQAAM